MERKDRFEASQSNEGRYRMLIDAVTDYAIYMLDPDGTITSWREILGENFSRFYTDEDRESGLPQRALETAAREGKFESEGWRIRKDGTKFWASVVIDPIRDSSGKLVGFAKITRDLTERMQAETVLRQNQEQFRLLVQGVTDYAIYLLSPEGNVASWNSGAHRIKGYRPEEISASTSRAFTPKRTERQACRKRLLKLRRARAASRRKACGSAKTERRFSPTSLSSRSAIPTESLLALPRSRVISPSASMRRARWIKRAKRFSSRRRWKPSGI